MPYSLSTYNFKTGKKNFSFMESKPWSEREMSGSNLTSDNDDSSSAKDSPNPINYDRYPGKNASKFTPDDNLKQGSLKCIQEISQNFYSDDNNNPRTIEIEKKNINLNKSLSSESLPNSIILSEYENQNDGIYLDSIPRSDYKPSSSVLSLSLIDDKLFSGSENGNIYVWDTDNYNVLYKIISGSNSGSIFSIVYIDMYEMIIVGCQNTTIQWFSLKNKDLIDKRKRMAELILRKSKFFEGSGNPEATTNSPAHYLSSGSKKDLDFFLVDKVISNEFIMDNIYIIFDNNTIPNAHYGYVNSIASGSLPCLNSEVLFSASSDNTIKIWKISDDNIDLLDVLLLPEDEEMNILSIAINDGLLYAGMQGGDILIWDLETRQPIRALSGHTDDVLSIVCLGEFIYTGSYDGKICVWTTDFEPVFKISAHDSSHVLSMSISHKDKILVSGSSDSSMKFWIQNYQSGSFNSNLLNKKFESDLSLTNSSNLLQGDFNFQTEKKSSNFLISCLDKWISFKSVSGFKEFQHECRSAARFLRDLAFSLGASESKLIAGSSGRNPLVYFRFDANENSDITPNFTQETETILIYGHYDVVPIGNINAWNSDPFSLKGKDGYLYGRGVTDNKGPVLSMLFAVYELFFNKQLSTTIVFLIEGEEEHACEGLSLAVQANSHLFGKPKLILLSSSYWLGENTPCLTYGLRGNIRVSLEVDSLRKGDIHSGVWGGASTEPLVWLTNLVSKLSHPDGRVEIPGFNDYVDEVSTEEYNRMMSLVDSISENELNSRIINPHSKSDYSDCKVSLNNLSITGMSSTLKSNSVSKGESENDFNSSIISSKKSKVLRQLMSTWRYPTLSVHKISLNSSTSTFNFGLIPSAASATISIRTVPSQTYSIVSNNINEYIKSIFSDLVGEIKPIQNYEYLISDNKKITDNTLSSVFELIESCTDSHKAVILRLKLDIQQISDWWLAKTDHPYYKLASKIISQTWNERLVSPIQKHKSISIEADNGIPSKNDTIKKGGIFTIKGIDKEAEVNNEINQDRIPTPALSRESENKKNGMDSTSSNSVNRLDRNYNDVLFIREGGSIPAVPWLENFFGGSCVCMNFPMGQSSDNAHLPNERIRLINLMKGKSIVKDLIYHIGGLKE
ncbi:putative di- and tripeptidase DUG2 [Smittium culicis]|uniref:Putative di-and tripeptidase DUG2 n=1 Tax=Smittium culicis TaxID=133412 RepID=A0A1R1YSD4_9FUNG|nr:putative di- and tripeptidase DUG2 [Smittium culicis]